VRTWDHVKPEICSFVVERASIIILLVGKDMMSMYYVSIIMHNKVKAILLQKKKSFKAIQIDKN